MTYSEMAQVLMKFFGQILPDTLLNRESNTSLTERSNIPTNSSLEESKPPVKNPQNNQNSVLSKLRESSTEINNVCNRNTCSEWSTEGLLKSRLCCLNAPQDTTETTGSGNATEEAFDPNDSQFGCELYARSRCKRIMPMIRCCLRNVLNKYFDFTLKMREQQQQLKQQPVQQSSIRIESSALNQKGITESGYRMEYPSDYILHHSIGSQLIPDYFKQQHRKRVFQTAPPQRT